MDGNSKNQRNTSQRRLREDKKKLDEALNDALKDTFPASDPVSITRSLKPGTRSTSSENP